MVPITSLLPCYFTRDIAHFLAGVVLFRPISPAIARNIGQQAQDLFHPDYVSQQLADERFLTHVIRQAGRQLSHSLSHRDHRQQLRQFILHGYEQYGESIYQWLLNKCEQQVQQYLTVNSTPNNYGNRLNRMSSTGIQQLNLRESVSRTLLTHLGEQAEHSLAPLSMPSINTLINMSLMPVGIPLNK